MFADDLTMLSRKKSGLDKMLQTWWEYSIKWQFTFNIKKTVVLTYGEKQEEHGTNCAIRKWKPGSLDISEKDARSNLGKIWDINKNSSVAVLSAVGRGREVCFFLMSLGSRYGGLNPIIASYLWKRIGIPKFLYGSELWKLSKDDLIELERVQNIMLRIMQGLLPGTSGSAARGLLGMLSIEAEIDRRKLYFLGRLINISAGVLCRRVLFIRLARWKWNHRNNMTGFVPDIVCVLTKYDLLDHLMEFVSTNCFPTKKNWKKIVNLRVYEKYNCVWQEKIKRNKQLYFYSQVNTNNEISEWWLLAKEHPKNLLEITNIIRLLCGSYKIRGKRVSNPVVYTDLCEICQKSYINPVNHALLYCLASHNERENLWNWIVDNFEIESTVNLVALSDSDFILTILGQNRETLGLDNEQ
jgi:hypothetical protein